MRGVARHLLYFLGYGALVLAASVILAYGWHLSRLPDPKIWHNARLESEFRATDAERVRTLTDYRALEDRLFAELKRDVYDRVTGADRRRFNRYASGSLADPTKERINWNRTFEFPSSTPRGVLLLHGLSDSPYTMRALGEALRARGYYVVGLRLPGHGTAPAGLLEVRWQDWAAAVRLAARDLAGRIGTGGKLYMVGYSTGAALAMEYALARLQGESLPAVERLVLLSPAIGVSPAAALAVWQARISVLFGSAKLAWSELTPEYDPYKYSSFPVNAGDQIYRLTVRIGEQLAALGKSGPVAGLPRILAFQSAADSTVSTPAVVRSLFGKLAHDGHQLVLFDINRNADAAELYVPGVPEVREKMLHEPAMPFDLTVVTNRDSETNEIVLLRRESGNQEVAEARSGMVWPRGIYSLSHMALPFPPSDPVYGARRPSRNARLIYLGRTELYGERGLLAIDVANLMRLRHNPFFDYTAVRIVAFLDNG